MRVNQPLTKNLKFPHIYVLEASAGSGKTKALAERYVDFLLHYSGKTPVPINFRNILAVTFTNEAADQMRQEILQALKSKGLAPLENSFLTGLGQNRDSPLAMQIVDEIIRNFSDFAVRTIDSFVHSLLVASSLEMKLPPDYEIKRQARPYLEYTLDTLLDEVVCDKDLAHLFSRFLEHFLMVEGQKQWNPKKILLSILDRFYQEENSRAKPFREISENLDLGLMEVELKSQIEKVLCSLNNQKFIKSLSTLLNKKGVDFLKGFRGVLNKEAWKNFNSDLAKGFQRLKVQHNNYAHAFVWLRYSFYLKVFCIFRKRLEDFKEEKRIVFLDELNKKARQFLTSQGLLPAEIYYKLSTVLYHYLIDEFQDTSILQWENIQALVEDALSKGGSLFYVGDKKQAIYRFRGGEVELFDLIKARFKNRVAKIYDEVLLYNYRSRKVIVEFNNLVFSQQNLKRFLGGFPVLLSSEYQEKILEVFKDSQQEPKGKDYQGGYVRLEILEGKNIQQSQECLNIKLKETILELKERFSYQDILILVRDNQEVQEIADFLLEQGFPVCASRTISIRQNYLIREIIALLKFLNSPIDNLSFANFILGEVFSKATHLSTEDLRLWFEDLRINEKETVLYTRFRSANPSIWQEFLQYLFNAVGFLPVYDLVKTILIRFRVEENFPHLRGFTQRLLEILNELEEQGRNSLSEFLEWFEDAQEEELFVQLPSGLDAIKILTIHKAKGLSSPVVILPYAAFEVKVARVAFEAPKSVYESPEGLYLLYLQKDICSNHPELNLIYQREYFQALLDELNCLYVGFTRAAGELYIFLPRKVNRRDNPLIRLLFDKEASFKELGKRAIYPLKPKRVSKEIQKEAPVFKGLPQEIFKDLLKPQLIQASQIASSQRRNLTKRGEVLHYLLAEIEPLGFLNNLPAYIPKIKDACRLFNYSDSEEIIQCLADFFAQPQMQRFFSPEFQAFNEKEVVDQYGNLKRIDRLVFTPLETIEQPGKNKMSLTGFTKEKILIIDYKTGEEYQEGHHQQIKEYACLIKELYPDRLLEGWLIYIDTKEARRVSL